MRSNFGGIYWREMFWGILQYIDLTIAAAVGVGWRYVKHWGGATKVGVGKGNGAGRGWSGPLSRFCRVVVLKIMRYYREVPPKILRFCRGVVRKVQVRHPPTNFLNGTALR